LLTLNHPTSFVRRRPRSHDHTAIALGNNAHQHFGISFPDLRAGLELWNLFALVLLKGFDERDDGRKIGRLECVEANHHGAISPPI